MRWGAQSLLLSANARQGEKGGAERGGRKWRGGRGEVTPSVEGALYHSANVFAAGNRAERQAKASRMDAKIAPKQINF